MVNSKIGDQIRLIDFGSAQKISPSEKLKNVKLNFLFAAPETNTKNYDQKCDVIKILISRLHVLSELATDQCRDRPNKKDFLENRSIEKWSDFTKRTRSDIQKVF
ncbi:protein kinase domain containing protein [Stylonychia lemnae]|uniref:Protein kinase domain containing protein n=1 Tax=Stylonychia lemnae TaxID=5949 RepID=A0A078ANF0_STYLE|nr:protein kinase domain containing protein [Stylonychia lemnae]|eukprot:CDW83436.1 protein kinase domain containing protein [Stylonychia lemnae]